MTTDALAIPYQGPARWDEHRNTSRVFAVPPQTHDELRAALAHFRRTEPAHVAWIEDGHPNLTAAEHIARFGQPYKATRSRKTRA